MNRLVLGTKFWIGVVEGATLRTQFGKVGSPGQIRLKAFATPAAAKAGLAAAVAAKRGEGYRDAKVAPKPAKANGKRAALLELATTLGGATVAAQVALAFDDPDAYAKKYATRMDDRSLEPGDKNLAWIALVDALHAKKRLVDLDWKHASEDALEWISGLAKPAGRRALAPILDDVDTLAERTTDEALELAGATLARTGEALLELDISSDSFEMIVVPAADVATLVKLARAAGERIVHFEGKQLAALEKARLKKTAKAAKARGNPWGALVENTWEKNAHGVLWDIRHDAEQLDHVRAAREHVPARERPLVELALGLNGKTALAVARDAKDPRLCLVAAQFMAERSAAQIAARIRATVILARRLKLAPGAGKDHEAVAIALNLFGDERDVDAAIAALPAADRALLARLADGLFAGSRRSSGRMGDALRALKNVGDATSLALLEANGDVDDDDGDSPLLEAMARIRKRTKVQKATRRR